MPYLGAKPDKGNFADLNGAKLVIDADADTSLTSDTDDQIDVEVAGADVLQIKSSSGDAVIKAAVDAKDILFQQYDGRTLLDINDGGYVAIANGATGAGQLRLYEDTDNGTNFTAFQVGTQSADLTYTLPTADGSDGHALKTDGSGTLSWGAVAANTPSSADGQALGSASLEWSDLYLADGGVIYFGNDQDIKLTHSADSGLLLKHVATADDKPINLVLQTGETDMAANDVIGKISFQAPDEGTGTDAVLVSAAIQARAEGDHSSSSNASSIDFMTGASEAAATKWSITSAGSFLNAGTNTIDMNAGELILDADADTSITASTDDQIDIRIAGADDFTFTANTFTAASGSGIVQTDGTMYMGETANGGMTLGLTMNQGAADNNILEFKSSDVAHDGTAFSTETDTYAKMGKWTSTGGGLYISGYNEAATGMVLAAWGETQPVTTPATTAYSHMTCLLGVYESSDYVFDANSCVWGLRKYIAGGSARTIFIIDEDGDLHLDGASNDNSFDDEDDALLCRSLDLMRAPKNVIRSEFDSWTTNHKSALEDAGIISKIDPDNPDFWEDGKLGDPMVNITQLQRLHNGAIWQQRAMFETMKQVAEEMLPGFGAKLNERLVEQKLPALPVPA